MRFWSFACITLVSACAWLQGCTARSEDAADNDAPDVVLARGVVDVDGGLLPVLAQRDGHVTAVNAVLGNHVEAGTVLAQLNDGSEQSQVDVARGELQHARAELAAATARLPLLQDQFDRVREAEAAGAESGRSLDELRLQFETQRAEIPIAEAAVATAGARLRGAVRLWQNTAIRAPAAGRIVQVSARIGMLVSANDTQPLFLIRPQAPLIVRATVSAGDADRITPGAPVSIEPADYKSRAYAGRVREIGELVRKPDSTQAADDFASDRAVDCVIDIGEAPLRIGSPVLARFAAVVPRR